MKKLPIVLCLMLLSIVLFNSRAHAVFITHIDSFVQDNGTAIFSDSFTDGFEPPSGPSGGYVVEGTFGSTRELGSKLELNSDDGVLDPEGDIIIGAAVSDSPNFFSSGTGGHVIGTFDFTGGLPSTPFTFFGIEIFNFASDGSGGIVGDPTTDVEAWMGVVIDDVTGHLIGNWGDASMFGPLGSFDFGVVGATTIGLKLEIDSATSKVSALFDYAGGGFATRPGSSIFTTLDFTATTGVITDIYTGAFLAGEETAIPEPATIVLLGIGLVGLAGAAARRRFKKQ